MRCLWYFLQMLIMIMCHRWYHTFHTAPRLKINVFFSSQHIREKKRMMLHLSFVTIRKNNSGLDLSIAFKRANLVKFYLYVGFAQRQFRYRPYVHYRNFDFVSWVPCLICICVLQT
jgi:hypothetical protein